jgi:hypothetical protein
MTGESWQADQGARIYWPFHARFITPRAGAVNKTRVRPAPQQQRCAFGALLAETRQNVADTMRVRILERESSDRQAKHHPLTHTSIYEAGGAVSASRRANLLHFRYQASFRDRESLLAGEMRWPKPRSPTWLNSDARGRTRTRIVPVRPPSILNEMSERVACRQVVG